MPHKHSPFGVYLCLLLTAALWGSSFVFTRYLFLSEPALTPVMVITVRLVVAALFLWPCLLAAGRVERLRLEDLHWFVLLALLEPFLYFLFENNGLRRVPGGLSSIIIATIPIFVPFGLYAAYREKLHWLNWLGLLLSLGGVALMILGKGDGSEVSLQGILYLVCAVITAVIYSVILVKMVNKYRPYTLTLYTNMFGLFLFLPLFLLCGHFSTLVRLRVTAGMWGALLCLGIGCSVLAYVLFNFGVRAVGAVRASVFNNIIPLFTLFLAVMIGQEAITWQKLAGMVVTVAGVCIAQKKPGKPRLRTTCGIRTRGPQNENLIS